jgi:outer membrane protein TolC
MIKMKYQIIAVLALLFLLGSKGISQPLSLDSCIAKAERAYPLVQKYDLIEQSKEYSISNAQKGYLPQITIAGYSSYQSDILTFPFEFPGAELEPLRQDLHNFYGEVNQPITDLFTQKNQTEKAEISAEIDRQSLEVDMYQLRDRVNQIYFGILLIDAQIKQSELLKNDVQSGIDRTETAIENGIALKSSADVLRVELLKIDQRIIELESNKRGFTDMLSLFINEAISNETQFTKPLTQALPTVINRPELLLFELQKTSLDVQSRMTANRTLPKLSAFFQGGVGAPGLNVIDNDPAAYYIAGLRLNWNISSFYTSGKEKRIIEMNRQSLNVQRDVFLFNTDVALKQQNAEIEKIEKLIYTDDEIIAMRSKIKVTTKNQLENGTATTTDFVTQVNAEDQAKQNRILHEIQLLKAQYDYLQTSGTPSQNGM